MTVKIKNTTGITVNVKCGERCYSIKSGGKEYIDIEENNVICAFRSDEKSLRLCLSLYLSKESVRNIWIFAPQAVVNLFSFFKVQPGVREINISQRKCSPFLCTVFNVFVFNGSDADSYAYVNKRDKAAVDFPLILLSIVFAVFAALLTITFLTELFAGLSLETVIYCLLCVGADAFAVWFAKGVSSFVRFNDKAAQSINKAKSLSVYNDLGWLIKYTEI